MVEKLIQTAGRIVHARWFQRLVIATIVLAGALAGIETDAAIVASCDPVLRVLVAMVLGIFIIEVVMKLTAVCPRPYASS